MAALAAASLPAVVVNPRQVRDFAKAIGRLAKTDSLDAAVLAHFAEAVRPPLHPLRDAETQFLNSLVARRQQVITMPVTETNRLSSAAMAVWPRIEAHIAWLKQELDDPDQGLRQTLRQRPVWREKDDLLRSVPGIPRSQQGFGKRRVSKVALNRLSWRFKLNKLRTVVDFVGKPMRGLVHVHGTYKPEVRRKLYTRIPHLAQTSDAVNRQLSCFSSRYMNLLAVFQI